MATPCRARKGQAQKRIAPHTSHATPSTKQEHTVPSPAPICNEPTPTHTSRVSVVGLSDSGRRPCLIDKQAQTKATCRHSCTMHSCTHACMHVCTNANTHTCAHTNQSARRLVSSGFCCWPRLPCLVANYAWISRAWENSRQSTVKLHASTQLQYSYVEAY